MSKDIFKIHKVNEMKLLDIQFALSAHEPLNKFLETLAPGLQNHSDPEFSFQK